MAQRRMLVVSACALGLWSCTGKRSSPDAASTATDTPDAGSTTAETPDAGPTLVVTPDAGPVDLPLPPPPPPPFKKGDWIYYGAGQGLSSDVQDVSADEGGNVYVAGGDALYVKTRADEQFVRFDSENGGITKNCIDDAYSRCDVPGYPSCDTAQPPPRYYQCRILSVAGAEAGKAIIGLNGYGDELQYWTFWGGATGGADVVLFDAQQHTVTRARHVFVASPPHTVCTDTNAYEERAPPGYNCPKLDRWWLQGRALFRRVRRIVVNHDHNSVRYGDAWMCGEHATFAALFNNAAQRGLFDRTAGYPDFADAKDTFEHLHPALYDSKSDFVNGSCTALSLAPDGTPWASNQYRTAYVAYPGPDLSNEGFAMQPVQTPTCPTGSKWCPPPYRGYDLWPDPWDAATQIVDFNGPSFDGIAAATHCADGTLWLGSTTHGLSYIDPSGAVHPNTPIGDPIVSLACDPDGSLWIGFQGGGIGRLRDGRVERVNTSGLPEFATHDAVSIQIDRWPSGGNRIVYFAFGLRAGQGSDVLAGGVGAYAGP